MKQRWLSEVHDMVRESGSTAAGDSKESGDEHNDISNDVVGPVVFYSHLCY